MLLRSHSALKWKTSFFSRTLTTDLRVSEQKERGFRFCRAFDVKDKGEREGGAARQQRRGRSSSGLRCPKPWPGISTAAKYARKDAIILDERARSDLSLLQR